MAEHRRLISRHTFIAFSSLTAGTLAAQLVNFFGFWISTKYLSPADFGIFAVYLALSTPIAIVATGKYEASFIRAYTNVRVANLFFLSIALLLFLIALILPVLVIVSYNITSWIGNAFHWELLLYLVAAQGLYSLITSLSYFNRQYNMVGLARLVGATSGQFTSIGLALLGHNGFALGVGVASGLFMSSLLLGIANASWLETYTLRVTRRRVMGVARIYRDVSLFTLPQALASAFQDSLAIAVITATFGTSGAGLFSLANRLVGAPVAIMAESLGRLFERYAAEVSAEPHNARAAQSGRRRLNQAVAIVVAISFVFGLVGATVGPLIVRYAFDNKWLGLVDVVQPSILYYAALLAGATLVNIPLAIGAEFRAISVLATAGSAAYVLLILIGAKAFNDLSQTLYFVAIFMIVYFVVLITLVYRKMAEVIK